MDSPALGKAELVVGGCASWTFSKGGRRKFLRSKAQKKTAQRTARAPCAASLAASHVHSSRAAPAAGTPLAHTRLQGMLTGAPVLCIWGVILDLTWLLRFTPGDRGNPDTSLEARPDWSNAPSTPITPKIHTISPPRAPARIGPPGLPYVKSSQDLLPGVHRAVRGRAVLPG